VEVTLGELFSVNNNVANQVQHNSIEFSSEYRDETTPNKNSNTCLA